MTTTTNTFWTRETLLLDIATLEADADRHERDGRHRIASIYRTKALQERLNLPEAVPVTVPETTAFANVERGAL